MFSKLTDASLLYRVQDAYGIVTIKPQIVRKCSLKVCEGYKTQEMTSNGIT